MSGPLHDTNARLTPLAQRGTMAITHAAELDYARRRARAGLWIGPGFFLIAGIAVAVFAQIVAPGSKNAGRGLMMMVIVMSALLHIGCFLEFIIVVKYLAHRPLPLAVLMLVGYWLLIAGVVVASAFAG
jgi:hypothetical protein